MNRPGIMLTTLCSCLIFTTACSVVGPVGEPSNALAQGSVSADEINWPEKYQPEDATFYVHNEIDINAAPEVVWNVIVQAEAWPDWYEGASNVNIITPDSEQLNAHAQFEWKTMGLNFTSVIKEWEPPYRLAWESRKSTIVGYHAWLIVPTENGSRLITDEAQFGFLANMQKIFMPNKLRRLHDIWLSEIKRKAET